jgi:hypothetical protein
MSVLTDQETLEAFRQWHKENAIWRVVVRKSPVSINVEGVCLGVTEKTIAFEIHSQEEPLYIYWSRLGYFYADPKMVRGLFAKDQNRTFSACLMADIPWPEAICFMKVEPSTTAEPVETNLDERAEFMRQVALVLLDTTAHHMAVRQLLYDAGLADEQRFQQIYTSILKGQLEVFWEALQTSDGARVIQIIEALSKTPRKT